MALQGNAGAEQALVEAALKGDADALDGLVKLLTGLIQAVVGAALFEFGPKRYDLRQYMSDMMNDVFVDLLKADKYALRQWDPARGSLKVYVGKIARNRVVATLRRKRSSPFTNKLTLDEDREREEQRPDEKPGPEERSAIWDLIRQRRAELVAIEGEGSVTIFEMVRVEEYSRDEVAQALGKSPEEIQAAFERVLYRVRKLRKKDRNEGGDE